MKCFFKSGRATVVFLLGILTPFTAFAQQDTPPSSGARAQSEPVFSIRGTVICEHPHCVPELLGIQLQKMGVPVEQSFVRSDQSFEFRNLRAANYTIVIKDDTFEEVNVSVEVFGRTSHTFFVTVLLNPRQKERVHDRQLQEDDEITNTISVAALARKVPKKALRAYQKSLEQDRKKQYTEAIVHLKEAIAVAPDFYSAQRNLGIDYYRLNLPKEALPPLQEALKLNPNSSRVNYFLGVILVGLHDFPSAQAYLEKSIALTPEQARPHYFLGYVFYKQNRLDDAEKSLKRALELDAEVGGYSRLQLANVYMKRAQLVEAYQQMETFLKTHPTAQEVSQVISNLKIMREMLGQPPANQP